MNTREFAWLRMLLRMAALVRVWELEKWTARDWHPSPAERALFEFTNDFWSDVFSQGRTRSPDKVRRACPSRDRLVTHDV